MNREQVVASAAAGPSAAGAALWLAKAVHPQRHPRRFGALLLWLLGLYFMLFATEFVPAGPEAHKRHDEILARGKAGLRELAKAETELRDAYDDLNEVKGWFWRFTSSAKEKEEIYRRQAIVDEIQARVNDLESQHTATLNAAKSTLGLWSQAGVGESKQAFWTAFENGKVFAKRQSLWDSFFILLSGDRDGEAMGLVIRLLLQTIINFAWGLTISCFVFLFRLPGIIISFSPNPVSGLTFFAVSAVGGIAIVASFIGLMVGASAGVVYALSPAMRLQGGAAGRRPARVAYSQQQRQHYD